MLSTLWTDLLHSYRVSASHACKEPLEFFRGESSRLQTREYPRSLPLGLLSLLPLSRRLHQRRDFADQIMVCSITYLPRKCVDTSLGKPRPDVFCCLWSKTSLHFIFINNNMKKEWKKGHRKQWLGEYICLLISSMLMISKGQSHQSWLSNSPLLQTNPQQRGRPKSSRSSPIGRRKE